MSRLVKMDYQINVCKTVLQEVLQLWVLSTSCESPGSNMLMEEEKTKLRPVSCG